MQKRRILDIAEQLHTHYGNDFAGWVNEFISFEGLQLDGLTEQQTEIGKSLTEDKNLAVSAGGGIGKTALAALSVLWFLSSHPFSKIPTTAPSSKQLNDILWSEISLWLKRCKLRKMFEQRSGRLELKGFKEWYAVARTVPRDGKDLNDTLAGFHAPHLLILVDEASGVPDPVFTALDGAMTQDTSYILLISNPVSSGGYYYDTIHDPKGKGQNFRVLYYNAIDSPLVSREYADRIIARYGKDSPMYRAKVLGLPIEALDSVVVTPAEFDRVTSENTMHSMGSICMACDVAGSGTDLAIIAHRAGNSIIRWDEFPRTDTTFLRNQLESYWHDLYSSRPDVQVIIDAHGLGAGVFDTVRESLPLNVIGFIGPEKSIHPTMYKDRRAEAYYALHKSFQDLHFPVPTPERLKKELANITFDYGLGPIAVEKKESIKRRLGFSPDYSDTLAMTCILSNYATTYASSKVSKKASNVLQRLKFSGRTTKYGRYGKFVT